LDKLCCKKSKLFKYLFTKITLSLTLLDMLVDLKKRYKIRVPIERKLEAFVLKRIVLDALKNQRV